MMEEIFENYKRELSIYLSGCKADEIIKTDIDCALNKIGIYYRIFSRTKSAYSTSMKLIEKEKKYIERGKGMQDIIGVRIVLYYQDDISIVQNILTDKYRMLKDDSEIDIPKASEFKPIRRNLVFELPDEAVDIIQQEVWEKFYIEKTFEVQIRTIFSEGWYEVEHDIRYKHDKEWENPEYYVYNRGLNRINATLETCDTEIVREISDLAYDCYKNGKVIEMLRYKFRIRLEKEELSEQLMEYIQNNSEFFKKLYRVERSKILRCYTLIHNCKSLNNLVYLSNELEIHDNNVTDMAGADRVKRLRSAIKEFENTIK